MKTKILAISKFGVERLPLILLMLIASFSIRAEDPLDNDGIIKMVRAGISEDVIVVLLKSREGNFVLTPDTIIALNQAHVTDKIITLMISKDRSPSTGHASSSANRLTDPSEATNTPKPNAQNFAAGHSSQPATIVPAQLPATASARSSATATQIGSATATPSPATAAAQTTSTQAIPAGVAAVAPASPAKPTKPGDGGTGPTTSSDTYHGFNLSDLTTAFVGTGWLLTANGTDYKVVQSSNVIESTGLGHKTPDFLLGVAFNTTLRPRIWKGRITNLNDPHLDGFVSLKFTPGSDSTINGLVLGGAVRIHPNLDIVAGVALTPQNAPSIGLRHAAYLAALSDRTYYANFVPSDLLLNKQQAFDGFPLLNQSGKPFYAGDPLTTQYRNGFFVGVAFPVSLSGLFKSQSNSAPSGSTTPSSTTAGSSTK